MHCQKPPGERGVSDNHGLDLRGIARIEEFTQNAQILLLAVNLGQDRQDQSGGIKGICCYFGSMCDQRARACAGRLLQNGHHG